MQVHLPDPDYLAATDSPARFRAAALLAAIFVAGIALVHVIDAWLGLGPRTLRDRAARPGGACAA